jgi:hypothetical protein
MPGLLPPSQCGGRWLAALLVLSFSGSATAGGVTAASYLGGMADDALTGVAIGSDGSIFVSGNSASATLAGVAGTTLEPGGGFVAKLDAAGKKLVWLSRIEAAGALKLSAHDEPLVVTGHHVTKLSADGSSVVWTGADTGSDIAAFDVAASGDVALVSGNDVFRFDADGTTQKFRTKTERSNAVAVAFDPVSGDVFASGDQNAGYGTCGGPWRSPFIFRYDASGMRTSKLYDYSGQAACDQSLAADSFFTQLRFEANGEFWVTGGADGGNTVLGRAAADLSKDNPALVGACFASACYGWKGAAAPRFIAHVNSGFTDFERATFVVAHFNKQPAGCSCDVPQDDGSGARPNSAGLDFVFRTSTGDVVGAGSAGWHFPVVNAWYPAAAYSPGYPAVVSVLDGELKSMKMATILPGTGSTKAAAYRGGRLVVVGSAPDNSAFVAPAGQEAQAEATITPLPVAAPLQTKFGGGKSDGFLYVACVTSDQECGAAPEKEPSGGGASPGGSATMPAAAGTSPTSGGSSQSEADSSALGGDGNPNASSQTHAAAGCGCSIPGRPAARCFFAGLLALSGVGRMRRYLRRKR